MASAFKIIPSAARELLYRLTETLEIPLTLTDVSGVVVASTAGRPNGQVDAYAVAVAQARKPLDMTDEQLQAPVGLLQPASGIYTPIYVGTEVAGVLFARGEPDDVRAKATSAAAAAGLGLEFASSATSSMRDSLGPDLALRGLLRGTPGDARRSMRVAKVAGWDLMLPRAALVIKPVFASKLPDNGIVVMRELINALATDTPCAQLAPDEWVALPALPQTEQESSVDDIAAEIVRNLGDQGVPLIIGQGETHIDLPILPGLRRSYREAGFCAQWAQESGATPGVYSLTTLGPVSFLAPGAKARRHLAARLLEPLRAVPDVLNTVRVFLDSNLSLEAAARQSGQHRHTVRSHLQRAKELTGLDPRTLGDAVQLKLALLLSPEVQSVH